MENSKTSIFTFIVLTALIIIFGIMGHRIKYPPERQYTVTFMTECDSVIHNYTFTKRYMDTPVARTKVEYITVDSSAWKLYTLYFTGDDEEFALYSSCGPIRIIDFR